MCKFEIYKISSSSSLEQLYDVSKNKPLCILKGKMFEGK